MRAMVLALAMTLAQPVLAEDTPAGRLAAFVTNSYLTGFAEIRADVARLEVLGACGDQELAVAFLDRVVAAELRARRDLIAAAEALEADRLPPVEERRALVTSLLDAFSATDATMRAAMLGVGQDGPPPEAVCAALRAEVLELLEQPQPTSLRP